MRSPSPRTWKTRDSRFWCGPGRDLVTLRSWGMPHWFGRLISILPMARRYSNCPVWHQDFLMLDLPEQSFDGIFANASLFHVPSQELPRILRQLRMCLRSNGILFASNPRGDNVEGWNGSRYGAFYDYDAWSRFMKSAGFSEVEHYYRPPGKPRESNLGLQEHGAAMSDGVPSKGRTINRHQQRFSPDTDLWLYERRYFSKSSQLPLRRGLACVALPLSYGN